MKTEYMKLTGVLLLCLWFGVAGAVADDELAAIVREMQGNGDASAGGVPPGAREAERQVENPAARRQAPQPQQDNSLNYLFDRRQRGGGGSAVDEVTRRLTDRFTALESGRTFRFDNEVMRTRFDKFLNTEELPEEDIAQFLYTYGEILDLLRQGDFNTAWRGLAVLGENPVDGGVSREIASRLDSVWQNRRHVQGVNDNIRQLRRDIDTAYWNADVMARRHQQENQTPSRAQPRSVPSVPTQTGPIPGIQGSGSEAVQFAEGKLRMTGEYLKSLEARGRIHVEEARLDAMSVKIRSDFADHISALFASRRHHQVVLAATFYRQMFSEGDYPVTMANQVNHSLNVIREVNQAIEAFRFKVDSDQLAGSAETLQAAFLAGEMHPALLGLERGEKQKIAGYWRDSVRMQNLIEARDYGSLEVLLDSLQERVSDFDPTKARAAITFAKLESRMSLGRARLHAQNGDVDAAMKELQAAAEAWPANPQLQEAAETFFQTQDVTNQTVVEFDQLWRRNDYRGIADRQVVYLAAVRDDAARFNNFQSALMKVRDAEMAIERAQLFARSDDHHGAWESVQTALEQWPDDVALNRLRSEYAIRCSGFVALLSEALEAERSGRNGLALALFVRARGEYPTSRIANEGIARLSPVILAANRN